MALLALGTVAPGCQELVSNTTAKSYVKECVLPDDQSSTLSGKWRATPVPVAFHEGDFGADELASITSAADTWNTFYKKVNGFTLLDYGASKTSPTTSTVAKPSSLCTQGILTGDKFTGQVVIYKRGSWPYSNHDAIALTSFCPSPAKPISNIHMAVMEVNYQDFFVEGAKQPDLESIFVHEFGHLLGLNHSCDMKGAKGFPDCRAASLSSEYYYAVMFPVIIFDSGGTGEKRRSLQSNDQGRSNCLYQPTE